MWQVYSIPQVCGTIVIARCILSLLCAPDYKHPTDLYVIFFFCCSQHLIYFCLPDTLTCQQECTMMSSLLWPKRQNLPRVLKIERELNRGFVLYLQ